VPDFLSLRAYAASRKARGLLGGSLAAVQKARDSGRIQVVDGKVDPDAADTAWLANTSVDQQARGNSGGARQIVFKAATSVGKTELIEADPEDYLAARARKEAALADLAEMEAAELRGDLVRTDDVVSCWGEMMASLRARLLVLPSMAAPQVSAPGRALEVQGILAKLVNEALSELSDGVPESVRRRKARHAEDSPATA